MMINLICPSRIENDDISSVVQEKYSTDKKLLLKKLLVKIHERYSEFSQIELSSRILTTVNFSNDEKLALKSLYSSQTATARAISDCVLKALLAKQAGCCLSYGIGEVDQIDHFLPQEHFPEYSILHKNLVPICGLCNEIKGENIPGSDRDFLHIMFDALPMEPFLDCDINYDNNIPIAHFSVKTTFASHRLSRHFHSLKLGKRLQEKATQYFLQIRAFKNEFGDEFAITEINRDFSKVTFCFSPTFWKAILCDEMLKSDFITRI